MARKEIDVTPQRKTRTAVVRAPRTDVGAAGDWRSELSKYAAKTIKMEESTQSSNRISTKGGRLTYHDTPLRDNKMTVIILSALVENVYYDQPFDQDNPRSPVCFAFSDDGDNMAPHEKAKEPQNETCDGCPRNEWGSADRGRGKACKNVRRLALLSCEDATPKAIEDGEIATLEVSVTSVKGYSGYVKQLALSGMPSWAWQTVVGLERDDGDTYSHLTFMAADRKPMSEKLYPLILKRVKEAEKMIDAPYLFQENAEQPKRGKTRAAPPNRGRTPAAKPPVKGKRTKKF